MEGDVGVLLQLTSTLARFTPDLEILPGTKDKELEQEFNDFEVGTVGVSHE